MSEPLPEGVFHLLVADADRAQGPFRMCGTVCGELVCPSSLPPSCFDEVDNGRDPRYCPACVQEALRWSAGEPVNAGLVGGVAGDGARGLAGEWARGVSSDLGS